MAGENGRPVSGRVLGILGSNIRRIRERRRETYLVLQQRTGYSRQYISALESGEKDVQLSTAVRLAEALDVPLGQMFSRGFDGGSPLWEGGFLADDFLLVFSTNVRRILSAVNKRENHICEKTDMDPETLSRILNRKTKDPRISTLAVIAAGVDAELCELLSRNEGGNRAL